MPAGQALADTHTPFEIDHQYTGKDTPQPRLLLRKSSHHYARLAHAAHLQHHKTVSQCQVQGTVSTSHIYWSLHQDFKLHHSQDKYAQVIFC